MALRTSLAVCAAVAITSVTASAQSITAEADVTGGVSSDLWKVELPGRTLCVKGALAQLKVQKEWRAPTSRNRVEYQWLQFAGAIAPGQVPEVLAHDER